MFWVVDVLVCRHFGLSTFQYVDILVCQRFCLSTFWLSMFWFVNVLTSNPCQYQTITWPNVDLSLVNSRDIHLMEISQDILQPIIAEIGLKITYLKLYYLPVANELTQHKTWHCFLKFGDVKYFDEYQTKSIYDNLFTKYRPCIVLFRGLQHPRIIT